jgi:hypothetical protein
MNRRGVNSKTGPSRSASGTFGAWALSDPSSRALLKVVKNPLMP